MSHNVFCGINFNLAIVEKNLKKRKNKSVAMIYRYGFLWFYSDAKARRILSTSILKSENEALY